PFRLVLDRFTISCSPSRAHHLVLSIPYGSSCVSCSLGHLQRYGFCLSAHAPLSPPRSPGLLSVGVGGGGGNHRHSGCCCSPYLPWPVESDVGCGCSDCGCVGSEGGSGGSLSAWRTRP